MPRRLGRFARCALLHYLRFQALSRHWLVRTSHGRGLSFISPNPSLAAASARMVRLSKVVDQQHLIGAHATPPTILARRHDQMTWPVGAGVGTNPGLVGAEGEGGGEEEQVLPTLPSLKSLPR